jgi:hypothetical protein
MDNPRLALAPFDPIETYIDDRLFRGFDDIEHYFQ